MAQSTAETIREITRQHLTHGNGLLLGQCVTAVGWIAGTVPDCNGIIELPTTDVAGSAFAVGCALAGRRPIFVVRYQGFMWLNSSSLVNYAAKSKEVWGVPAPVFIRAIGMEGGGTGHTASSCLHSIFMHSPGMPVAAPVTPGEYQAVWNYFMANDMPVYVSEHRKTFMLDKELPNIFHPEAPITLFSISAARLNSLEALEILRESGIHCNLVHVVWLKPFSPSQEELQELTKSGLGLVIDSDYEIAGASRSLAYELMHATGMPVYALGLEDRVCGASVLKENITPSAEKIADRVRSLLAQHKLRKV
jgi:acetoin:2,6-dichlorophenolindophenol oxidoreductase subunit beta